MVHMAEYVISSEDGTSLAVYHWRSSTSPAAFANTPLCAVLVHQYTKMGGSGALMRGMAKCLNNQGLPVVTFDMRGAGKSRGRATWTGSAEVRDVVAVCRWVVENLRHEVLLIGSSAGAPIAGSALRVMPCIRGYVAVGYVFGWFASWLFGKHYRAVMEDAHVPKLFIMGERDGFTTAAQLKARVAMCQTAAEIVVMPGVGHFELETAKFDHALTCAILQWVTEHQFELGAECSNL